MIMGMDARQRTPSDLLPFRQSCYDSTLYKLTLIFITDIDLTMRGIEMTEDRFVRIKELVTMLGISQSSIYRLMQENKFPKQIKLTERTVVWRLSVINAWVAEKENATK